MQASLVPRAVAAATAVCEAYGLPIHETVVLHDSNKLTVRLDPAGVVARVGLGVDVAGFEFETECAMRLVAAGAPVAALDPRVPARVHEADAFAITLWTHHASNQTREPPAAVYADALERLHAAMRRVELAVPHFTDRVQSAQDLVADPVRTPRLAADDRRLLAAALRALRRLVSDHGRDQLLHGEPHPGNVLDAEQGPLFIDLETCCRGPVEFDLAHAPELVADHYRGVDHGLLAACRLLVLAMVTTWRWDVHDHFPNGHRWGRVWLDDLRRELAASAIAVVDG